MKKDIIKSSKIWLDLFKEKIKKKNYIFKSNLAEKSFKSLNDDGFVKINVFDLQKDTHSLELVNYFELIQKNFKSFEKKFSSLEQIINPASRKADYQVRAVGTKFFDEFSDDFKHIIKINPFREILHNYFKNDLLNMQNDFWITFKNRNIKERQASQRWHTDPEFHRVIKIFFYLEDVNEENGPTEYIPKSFFLGKKNSLLLRLYNFPHISSYYPEWFINFIYNKKNRHKILAKKGDILILNSTGVHRGGYLENGFRKLAIFSFTSSKSPYLKEIYI